MDSCKMNNRFHILLSRGKNKDIVTIKTNPKFISVWSSVLYFWTLLVPCVTMGLVYFSSYEYCSRVLQLGRGNLSNLSDKRQWCLSSNNVLLLFFPQINFLISLCHITLDLRLCTSDCCQLTDPQTAPPGGHCTHKLYQIQFIILCLTKYFYFKG